MNITNDTKIFYMFKDEYKYSINEVIDIILENNYKLKTELVGVVLCIKLYNHNGILYDYFEYGSIREDNTNYNQIKKLFLKKYKKSMRINKIKHFIDG